MLVIIPARLGSSRLPQKALAVIGRDPLVVHCWKRAVEADIGPVHVATDCETIAHAVRMAGGEAVLTGECASGTDRVAAAAAKIDPYRQHKHVMNLQGDLPFIDPEVIGLVAAARQQTYSSIVTPVHRCEHVVFDGDFRRVEVVKHIGIYAYTRDALDRFARMPQSEREKSERLEQLRAVDNWLSIETVEVGTFPLEINTPADLVSARQMADCLI